MFNNLTRALKIAPLLETIDEDQFNFLLYTAKNIHEANAKKYPVFVLSEEMRMMVKAMGIKGVVTIVDRSESYLYHELLNAKTDEDAERISNELFRLSAPRMILRELNESDIINEASAPPKRCCLCKCGCDYLTSNPDAICEMCKHGEHETNRIK